MKLTFKVWRQNGASGEGKFETYAHDHVDEDSSFLETIDEINSKIITEGGDPITFDHDCREGICGSCSMTIDGKPHGPLKGTTACQLHMREFTDGETVTVEPWRAQAFPVIKDLMVDRTAFDRIIQKGGYISVNTGNAVDANSIPVDKNVSDEAFEAAACIGCGACVAACKNASAMLFVSAKVAHLNMLPQGKTEAKTRAVAMLDQMDEEGFGSCTNTYACEAECPKGISVANIARLNREFIFGSFGS